jgi:hypothetical protein
VTTNAEIINNEHNANNEKEGEGEESDGGREKCKRKEYRIMSSLHLE